MKLANCTFSVDRVQPTNMGWAYAIVIGNSDYSGCTQRPKVNLSRATRHSDLVATLLEDCKVKVYKFNDAKREEILDIFLQLYQKSVKDKKAGFVPMILIYYSGYGYIKNNQRWIEFNNDVEPLNLDACVR